MPAFLAIFQTPAALTLADLSGNCGRIGIDVERRDNLSALFFGEFLSWHGRVTGLGLRNTPRPLRRPMNASRRRIKTTLGFDFPKSGTSTFLTSHQPDARLKGRGRARVSAMAFARKKRLLQFSVLILAAAAAVGLLHWHYAPMPMADARVPVSRNTNAISIFPIPMTMGNDCLIIQNQCSAQCGGAETSPQPVAHQTISPASRSPPAAHMALSLMTRTAEPGACPTFPRTRTAPTEARSAFAAHTGRIALSSLLSRIYVPPSRQAGRTLWPGPKTRTAIRRKRMPFRTAPKRQKQPVRSDGRTAIRHKIRRRAPAGY